MEKTVTLTLTARCNLACTYCYETHLNKQMSFLTAKKILDFEISSMEESDYITIDFFGGEPFLEFDLIKKIVSYIKEKKATGDFVANYRFFATTNGTLVHGDIQKFLRQQDNFYLGLSLDGTKKMHDINRSNSFGKIDLDFFAEMYGDQPIKMTISAQTLPFLAEGIIFAQERGFRVACNLAYGIDWANKKWRRILLEQLEQLANYYLEHPNMERATVLSRKISVLGYMDEDENRQYVRKYCGTGTEMRTYDIDGKRYPCQFFMPISCGAEKASKAWSLGFKNEIPIRYLDAKCQACAVLACCPTCYGSNYVATGNIYSKDAHLCELEKMIFYANAWLYIKMWEDGQMNDLPEEELLATIIGARRIVESFKSEII